MAVAAELTLDANMVNLSHSTSPEPVWGVCIKTGSLSNSEARAIQPIMHLGHRLLWTSEVLFLARGPPLCVPHTHR